MVIIVENKPILENTPPQTISLTTKELALLKNILVDASEDLCSSCPDNGKCCPDKNNATCDTLLRKVMNPSSAN